MSWAGSFDIDDRVFREKQEEFIHELYLLEAAGVQAVLQSMRTDDARNRLFRSTRKSFLGAFKPVWPAQVTGVCSTF